MGLRLLGERTAAGVEMAAGEYGYDLFYCRCMLDAGAVGLWQVNARRRACMSGFMRVSALYEARSLPPSAHPVPSLRHRCMRTPAGRSLTFIIGRTCTITCVSSVCASMAR